MACMMSVHQCRFHWRHGFVRSAPASMTHKTPSVHLRTSLPHAHGSIPERSIVFQMHRSRSLTQRRKIERGGRRSHGQAKMHASNEAPRISTRRRTRQQRREREVSENKSDETASSASPNTIGKHHQRRRYVRSKPPKAMPGGRIINAGQGTLTEVSKSFYVAYGSAELSEATKDLHLVVPVKDELQEVTDEETPAPNPMSLPIITSSEKKDVRFQGIYLSCCLWLASNAICLFDLSQICIMVRRHRRHRRRHCGWNHHVCLHCVRQNRTTSRSLL